MKSSFNNCVSRTVALFVAVGLVGATSTAQAQLRLTEVMYNSVDTDSVWEWVEVENISGSAIDFSVTPYVIDDDDGNLRTGANIMEGIIPAGGSAVIVDGFEFGFDGTDPRFSNAWGPGINIIGASSFPPTYNNDGDRVGIWSSFASYGSRDFGAAIVDLDYTSIANSAQSGAPSIYWNGTGDSNNIANWQESVDGVDGAYMSEESFIGPMAGERLNSDDVGNPGIVQMTGAPSSSDPLIFTEIMYNPASNIGGQEAAFEWFEAYNNSGAVIDTTGYLFDDAFTDRDLTASNVEADTIAAGGTAIFYNGETVTEAQMQAAWGNGLTYIAVSDWGNLFNGSAGETIALWASQADYDTDSAGGAKDTTNAQGAITYSNGDGTWPDSNTSDPDPPNPSSIYLLDLASDEQDGLNWDLSDDGTDGSFTAGQMIADAGQNTPDHDGGEIGSPGPGFPTGMTLFDANVDMTVNNDDIPDFVTALLNVADWETLHPGLDPLLYLDGDGSGVVNNDDIPSFVAALLNPPFLTSSQVPEPSSVILFVVGACLVAGGVRARNSR